MRYSVQSLLATLVAGRGRRLLWSLCVVFFGSAYALGDDPAATEPAAPAKPALPRLEEMPLPPPENFLTDDLNTPRDWIVLTDGTVVSCLPISPRPNSVALRKQEIEAKVAERKGLAQDKVETWNREYEALQGFDITIPEQEPEPEYRVLLTKIDRIIHHEDLWLRRVDAFVQQQDVAGALELLGRLEQRRPDWPGIQQRVDDIIFTDGNLQLAAGQPEIALMLYEELSRRRPSYPNLGEKAAAAMDKQLATALAASDFRQVRYFLTRLQQIVPNTPLYADYTSQLSTRAELVLAQAKAAQSEGKLSDAVTYAEQAAKIWPDASGIANTLKSLTERYQRVRVAVTRLPGGPTAYPLETAADERRQRLVQVPLFEVASFEGGAARYRTRFFDEWMPYNLGRTMRFTLRQTRQPWESQPVLLGWPITDRLTERLDPRHPRFDERFAGYVDSMTVESPFEFTVAFRRVPPRLEALLTEPIVAAPSGATAAAQQDAAVTVTPLPAGGFEPVADFAEPNTAAYRRVFPEPDRQRQFHVAEVVEMQYPNDEAALRALQSGEADVLPNPPAWIARRVLNDESQKGQYFIQQHAIPETHVLQFNPSNRVLQSRELRRALQYMIDRQKLLDDVMLREPLGTQGRVIAGPFPSNSRSNAVGVEPRPYDPYAGLALTLAAVNSLVSTKAIETELPVLRILVPPDPVIREAVTRMIDGWGRIKIVAEMVPEDDLTAYSEGRWDLIYRRVQMTEPAVQLWPFLTLNGTARIEDLAQFPDWLKQEIIALDRASDYSRAEDRVQALHRHLSQEAALIPLWEIDQYTIYRKNLRGFPVAPIHCYDNIDQWVRESAAPTTSL